MTNPTHPLKELSKGTGTNSRSRSESSGVQSSMCSHGPGWLSFIIAFSFFSHRSNTTKSSTRLLTQREYKKLTSVGSTRYKKDSDNVWSSDRHNFPDIFVRTGSLQLPDNDYVRVKGTGGPRRAVVEDKPNRGPVFSKPNTLEKKASDQFLPDRRNGTAR